MTTSAEWKTSRRELYPSHRMIPATELRLLTVVNYQAFRYPEVRPGWRGIFAAAAGAAPDNRDPKLARRPTAPLTNLFGHRIFCSARLSMSHYLSGRAKGDGILAAGDFKVCALLQQSPACVYLNIDTPPSAC